MNYYQRKSTRLKKFNYSTPGYYFITICTANKLNIFGEIVDNEMVLSLEGQIALDRWLVLPQHHEGINLDVFIVMPNHVHGIVIIQEDRLSINKTQKQLLSIVVGSYKSSVSRFIRKTGCQFDWQKSFYDHIIRNDKTLSNIREYIQNNPMKWSIDIENRKSNILDDNYYLKMFVGK